MPFRSDVNQSMIDVLTPKRQEVRERPLTLNEQRAAEAYQAELARRIEEINRRDAERRAGRSSRSFGTLSALAARAHQNIDPEKEALARSLFMAKKLQDPEYRKQIEAQTSSMVPLPAASAIGAIPAPSERERFYGSEDPAVARAINLASGVGQVPFDSSRDVVKEINASVPLPEGFWTPTGFDTAAPIGSPGPMPPTRPSFAPVGSPGPMPPQRPADLPAANAAETMRIDPVRSAWERYNETGNAADFVRANALMMAAREKERPAEARGGEIKKQSASKSQHDTVHKALEIIHHLLLNKG